MKRILILGLAIILLFVGCSKDEETSPTKSLPFLTPEEIIDKASPKLDELKSFHFELSQKGGGTPIAMGLEMTGAGGDIAPPDKLAMKIEATWIGQFMETELITVGTTTYMTNPLNGKWELLPDDFTAVTLFQPNTGIKAVMESVTDLSLLDPEMAGGTLCFHLKGLLDSEDLDAIAVGHAAKGLPVETDIWIGAGDFLLRKVTFDGRICKDENDGIIRTLELSRFNEPVEIELPE
jgi:hypothetical protein